MKRKISAGGGLLFKGSGFYITDYRSKSYKEAAKKESAPSKSESKPAESITAPAKSAPKADKK